MTRRRYDGRSAAPGRVPAGPARRGPRQAQDSGPHGESGSPGLAARRARPGRPGAHGRRGPSYGDRAAGPAGGPPSLSHGGSDRTRISPRSPYTVGR
eukprot:21998-Hanusia_phi.AAC.1